MIKKHRLDSNYAFICIFQITGILHLGLTDACECNDPNLLLLEVLDPGLSLMRQCLQEACFKRFLMRLWDVLLSLLRSIVIRNVEVRIVKS